MKGFLKSILILTMILCFAISAFAVKILPYNMPLHDIMSWDQNSATLKIANPEGESVSVAWASTVDLWNYDGATWKFDLPSGDIFEFGKQVTLGNSTTAMTLSAATSRAITVYTTFGATTSGVVASYIESAMTGIGGSGVASEVYLKTNVILGTYVAAIYGVLDLQTVGGVTGVGSAICAELVMPGSASTAFGTFGALKLDIVCPANWALTQTAVSFIRARASGTTVAAWVTGGYLFDLAGMGTPADDTTAVFHLQNHVTTTHALRILVDGVSYDIPLVATTYSSN